MRFMNSKETPGRFIEKYKTSTEHAYRLTAKSIEEIFDSGYYTYKDLTGTGSRDENWDVPIGKIVIAQDKEHLGTLWVDDSDEDEYVDIVEILKEEDDFSRLRKTIEDSFTEGSSGEDFETAVNTLTELGLQTIAAAFIMVNDNEEIIRMYFPKALIPVLGQEKAERVANHMLLWEREKPKHKAIREKFRRSTSA